MSRSTRIKIILVASLTLALFAYVGSYLSRSMQGRYEPASIGLNGVKSYAWAPKGFVTDFKWNHPFMRVYFIPYYLDSQLWHTSDDAYGNIYPVNRLLNNGCLSAARCFHEITI